MEILFFPYAALYQPLRADPSARIRSLSGHAGPKSYYQPELAKLYGNKQAGRQSSAIEHHFAVFLFPLDTDVFFNDDIFFWIDVLGIFLVLDQLRKNASLFFKMGVILISAGQSRR